MQGEVREGGPVVISRSRATGYVRTNVTRAVISNPDDPFFNFTQGVTDLGMEDRNY